MKSKCEITISEISVFVKVKKERLALRVFIDNVEQDASKVACKLFRLIESINTIEIFIHFPISSRIQS